MTSARNSSSSTLRRTTGESDVAGATNTLSSDTSGDGGKGNGQSGFRIAGAGNLVQTSRAVANMGDGFTITTLKRQPDKDDEVKINLRRD